MLKIPHERLFFYLIMPIILCDFLKVDELIFMLTFPLFTDSPDAGDGCV